MVRRIEGFDAAVPKRGIPNDKIWQNASPPEHLSAGYQQVNLTYGLVTALHLIRHRLLSGRLVRDGQTYRQDGDATGAGCSKPSETLLFILHEGETSKDVSPPLSSSLLYE
jgi:hypothetical protein